MGSEDRGPPRLGDIEQRRLIALEENKRNKTVLFVAFVGTVKRKHVHLARIYSRCNGGSFTDV